MNGSSTDVVGTLRRNRKGLPSNVTKKKLRTDERIVLYEHHLGLAVTHWKYERDFFILTTCIGDGETVARGAEQVHILNVVHTYNQLIGSDDPSNQMATSYPTEKKSGYGSYNFVTILFHNVNL